MAGTEEFYRYRPGTYGMGAGNDAVLAQMNIGTQSRVQAAQQMAEERAAHKRETWDQFQRAPGFILDQYRQGKRFAEDQAGWDRKAQEFEHDKSMWGTRDAHERAAADQAGAAAEDAKMRLDEARRRDAFLRGSSNANAPRTPEQQMNGLTQPWQPGAEDAAAPMARASAAPSSREEALWQSEFDTAMAQPGRDKQLFDAQMEQYKLANQLTRAQLGQVAANGGNIARVRQAEKANDAYTAAALGAKDENELNAFLEQAERDLVTGGMPPAFAKAERGRFLQNRKAGQAQMEATAAIVKQSDPEYQKIEQATAALGDQVAGVKELVRARNNYVQGQTFGINGKRSDIAMEQFAKTLDAMGRDDMAWRVRDGMSINDWNTRGEIMNQIIAELTAQTREQANHYLVNARRSKYANDPAVRDFSTQLTDLDAAASNDGRNSVDLLRPRGAPGAGGASLNRSFLTGGTGMAPGARNTTNPALMAPPTGSPGTMPAAGGPVQAPGGTVPQPQLTPQNPGMQPMGVRSFRHLQKRTP